MSRGCTCVSGRNGERVDFLHTSGLRPLSETRVCERVYVDVCAYTCVGNLSHVCVNIIECFPRTCVGRARV